MPTSLAVVLAVTVLSIAMATVAITAIRGWVEVIRIRQGKDTPSNR